MRAETLFRTTLEIYQDFKETEVISKFAELITALEGHVSSPTEASQESVSTARTALLEATESSRFNKAAPSDQEILSEIDADGLLGKELRSKVNLAFAGNSVTPLIVLNSLKELYDETKLLSEEADRITDSLSYFQISDDDLSPGEFEIAVAIPCEAVDKELEQFGKEAIKLNQILGVFSELAEGSREPLKLRAIASSDLTIFLESAPAVAALVATSLERLAALYEKVLGIIKIHRDMKAKDMPTDVTEPLKKYIDKEVQTGIERIAKQIEKENFSRIEEDRKHELKVELRNSLRQIANRLDRGFGFDVRGEDYPPNEENDGEAPPPPTAARKAISVAVKKVEEARPKIKHFQAEQEPVLGLPEPDDKPKTL